MGYSEPLPATASFQDGLRAAGERQPNEFTLGTERVRLFCIQVQHRLAVVVSEPR